MEAQEVERLYRLYGPSVYRRALQILRNPGEAEDAMQEVFVTLLTKGDSFRGTSAVMTWLYSVTTHLCLNRLRNTRRRTDLLAEHVKGGPGEIGSPPGGDLLIRDLLRTLPEQQALAAVYYYLDELSHEEIAAQLGCSRRTVGNLLDRVRDALSRQEEEP